MSDEKRIFVNHPDGRICEIPTDVLERYVVPPERVKELAKEAAANAPEAPVASAPDPHEGAGAGAHDVVLPSAGQTVVFNFYLGPQARLNVHQPAGMAAEAPRGGAEVEGYHLDVDAFGAMSQHGEWRVGPYIDRSGRPSFGPHSHDPASGNAQ